MLDTAQQNLREPEQADWEHWGQSTYVSPPPALDSNNDPIVYRGVAVSIEEVDPDTGYLNFLLEPIKIVQSPNGMDGRLVRFTRASVRPFERDGKPIKGNPNKLGNYLRACGMKGFQTNDQYRNAVKASVGKSFPFVVDWYARNAETMEEVRGYLNFPDDPIRPGQKKSILRSGDVVTERDSKGNITGTRTVRSDILFANATVRYFKDALPRVV